MAVQKFVHGQYLGAELVKALNIARPVRSIVIKADCGKPASVVVEFVPTLDDVDGLLKVFAAYGLVSVPDGTWRDQNPLL
jgi:hypothetical protein